MNIKVAAVFTFSLLSSQVNAFTVDKAVVDTATTLNIPTLNLLNNNEKGWIRQEQLSFCLAEDQLRVQRHLPVSLKAMKHVPNYELTRIDDGVKINFSIDDMKVNRDLYQSLAYKISVAPQCSGEVERYLPVESVFGSNSQSELLTLADKYSPPIMPKVSETHLENTKPKSSWFMSTERDDAGNPVAVMFSQADSSQHTLLEVKCEALAVSLSVSVNDFLGNNSQNALFKFDQDNFKPVRLGLTDNSRGFIFTDISEVMPKLRNASHFILRYTNYNGVTQTLQYPLNELDSKLQMYPALCGTE
jgi:hypothetical protein